MFGLAFACQALVARTVCSGTAPAAPADLPAATNAPVPAVIQAAVTNAPVSPAGAVTNPTPAGVTNPPLPAATNAPAAAAPDSVAAATNATPVGNQAVYEDVAVLTEALLMVRRHYVEAIPYQKIVYGAIHGMLASLDPHSDFLEPRQVEGLKEETEGMFGGIGIQIGLQGGFPLVIAPIEDSPAYKAGLMAGDRITAIDGRPAVNFTMDASLKALRGNPGTAVTLTIARDGQELFDVRLVRDQIKVASVKGIRVLRGNIGYVRITQFSEPTAEAFSDALTALLTNRLEGLVLDLRDNPGGLLSQAIAVGQQLLPAKAVIVTTRGRDGVRPEETFRADGHRHLTDIPMAVLINRGSASASEIVAGALQDHHRAVLVGEKSFGKASVQNVIPLSTRPDCSLKLTTAHYYTPNGRLIHNRGIEPDIEVPQPPAAWRKAQIKRAYEEQPAAFPADKRESVEGVSDAPLERALDVLIGVRAFGSAVKR
ncbi:MAG: S41 family peptidase [Kiritimatiellae bacterium]|nr:S41 family peptidase [Kiritimatiellia bacterium]